MVDAECEPVPFDRQAANPFRRPYHIVSHPDRVPAAHLATHRIEPLRHPTQSIDVCRTAPSLMLPEWKLGAASG
jgi:hypothetical protein